MDVEAQVCEHEGPRRPMEENHLVEAKPEHEMALDLAIPRRGWLITQRSMKGEQLTPPRSARSSQTLGRRVDLRSVTREPSVGSGYYDEAD